MCEHIFNHHSVHFKYLTILYVVYTSVKLKFYIKKKESKSKPIGNNKDNRENKK